MRRFKLKLYDANGVAINTTGGSVYVTSSGGTAKSTIYNSAGATITNPIAMTTGGVDFYTANTLSTVDLYIASPTGHFKVQTGVTGGWDRIDIPTNASFQTMQIPFNFADQTAATEQSTGFTIPANAMMLPNPGLYITAIDATETMDVGTLSSASGDADGFIIAASLGTLGLVKGTVIASGDTLGAYFKVLDSANAGDDAPEGSVAVAGKVITYTMTTGSDTGTGLISLPYRLMYQI